MKTLKFRENEIMELIDDIMYKAEQIFMLLGLQGIGKSSIARNALNYIHERKFIHGGILWIQLKGVRDVYTVTKLIQRHIYNSLNLTRSDIVDFTIKYCTM